MSVAIVRTALSFCLQFLYVRTIVSVLTMRSRCAFFAAETLFFVATTLVKELHIPIAPNVLGMFVLPLIPIILSTGPLPRRLVGSLLTMLVFIVTETGGSLFWIMLTGGEVLPLEAGREYLGAIALVYVFIILTDFLLNELLITLFARFDRKEDGAAELPVIAMLFGSVVFFAILSNRLNGQQLLVTGAVALLLLWCVLGIVIGIVLVSVAQREMHAQRLAIDRQAQTRHERHLRAQVAATTQSSFAMRRLRHDLANQMQVVGQLAADGRVQEADRYLATLQEEARALGGEA